MSTGQLVFYGGAALLAVTILLAVVFLIRKPVYTPEKAVYDGAAQNRTQPFRSGYPTDPLTVRRDTPEKKAEETPAAGRRDGAPDAGNPSLEG